MKASNSAAMCAGMYIYLFSIFENGLKSLDDVAIEFLESKNTSIIYIYFNIYFLHGMFTWNVEIL